MFFSAFALFSCDKDFNEIGTGIIDDDHYGFDKIDTCFVAASTFETGIVQTDGLDENPFGVYNDPVFGTTVAHYVTQLQLDALNPTIEGDVELVDVTLYIPYDVTLDDTRSDGSHKYVFNSIKGDSTSTFNLGVYENNYFLRAQTHENDDVVSQRYYNDLGPTVDGAKGPMLNTATQTSQNSAFRFSGTEFVDTETDEDGEEETTYTAPGMRLKLDNNYFRTKILEAPSGVLASQNTFMNYFRGLYFSISSPSTARGAMNIMDFTGGTITVKYKTTVLKDHDNDDSTPDQDVTTDRTIVLNMTGTHVSLTSYQNVPAIPANRIVLKGGEGKMATIDILTPQQIQKMRDEKWLINEANLVFNIDRDIMTPDGTNAASQSPEPPRIFLYDLKNNIPILDYYYDNTTATDPKFNKLLYGGTIAYDENENNPRGDNYKIRVTNYLRSLVKTTGNPERDSVNVQLGLSLTQDISNIDMIRRKEPISANPTITKVPKAHVMSPFGTVLYGPNLPETDDNYSKRLKLVIYYTKPD